MDGIISYIGIGSNLGEPVKQCENAIECIARLKGVKLETVSSFYRTEPVGIEAQDYFVNAVAEIRTNLSAHNLFENLQGIEQEMGRKRQIEGGPRIIDLDLLFYGQTVLSEEHLTIPHPELHKRRFVLVPLAEIAPYFIHPSFGVSIRGLESRLRDRKSVEKIRL